jgi:hypothetical protein
VAWATLTPPKRDDILQDPSKPSLNAAIAEGTIAAIDWGTPEPPATMDNGTAAFHLERVLADITRTERAADHVDLRDAEYAAHARVEAKTALVGLDHPPLRVQYDWVAPAVTDWLCPHKAKVDVNVQYYLLDSHDLLANQPG